MRSECGLRRLALRLRRGSFGGRCRVAPVRSRFADGRHAGPLDAERGIDLLLDPLRDRGVLTQERLGVVAALAQALTVVAEERAGLLDDPMIDAEIDQAALRR